MFSHAVSKAIANGDVLSGRVIENPEVDANVVGRVGAEGTGVGVVLVCIGVAGTDDEEGGALKVNDGGQGRDSGSEAGVREPAADIGTSAKMLLALGVHSHRDGGRKAEGVGGSMLRRGAKVLLAFLGSPLVMQEAGMKNSATNH